MQEQERQEKEGRPDVDLRETGGIAKGMTFDRGWGESFPPDELVEAAAEAQYGDAPAVMRNQYAIHHFRDVARTVLSFAAPEIERLREQIDGMQEANVSLASQMYDAQDNAARWERGVLAADRQVVELRAELEAAREEGGLAVADFRLVCDTAGLQPGTNGPAAADEIGAMLDEREEQAAALSALRTELAEARAENVRVGGVIAKVEKERQEALRLGPLPDDARSRLIEATRKGRRDASDAFAASNAQATIDVDEFVGDALLREVRSWLSPVVPAAEPHDVNCWCETCANLPAAVPVEPPAEQPTVNRFEVIDETGRAYVRCDSIRGGPGVRVRLAYQDEGRTLKAFVEARGSSETTSEPATENDHCEKTVTIEGRTYRCVRRVLHLGEHEYHDPETNRPTGGGSSNEPGSAGSGTEGATPSEEQK